MTSIDIPPVIECGVESENAPDTFLPTAYVPIISWNGRLLWRGKSHPVTTYDGRDEERIAQREAHDHMVDRLRQLFD